MPSRVTGKKDAASAAFANGGLPAYAFDRLLVDEKGTGTRRLPPCAEVPKAAGGAGGPHSHRARRPRPRQAAGAADGRVHLPHLRHPGHQPVGDCRPSQPCAGACQAPAAGWASRRSGVASRWGPSWRIRSTPVTSAGVWKASLPSITAWSPGRSPRPLPRANASRAPTATSSAPTPTSETTGPSRSSTAGRGTWFRQKLAAIKKQPGPRKDSFPLSGLLYCGRCGGRMGGATSRTVSGKGKEYTYRKYVCYTARGHGRHACGNQSVREDRLLPFLVDRLRTVYTRPGATGGAAAQAARETCWPSIKGAPEQADRLRKRVADTDAEIVRGRRNLFRAQDDDTIVELNEELRATLKRRGTPGWRRKQRELEKGAGRQRHRGVRQRWTRQLTCCSRRAGSWRLAPPERLRAILEEAGCQGRPVL